MSSAFAACIHYAVVKSRRNIPQCRQVTPVIKADSFLSAAKARGYDFYTGMPCSFLTPMINRVISDRSTEYVPAASEGEAVAIAAGAWLAEIGRESWRERVCQYG